MDEVVSARIRLEGKRSGGDPGRLFAVLERARARSLVDLLHARPLSDVRKPDDLRKGERRIAALQLQLLRTTGRASRQRLLDEIFIAEEQLAPMTTELFTRSRRTARGAVTLREVQSALRPDEVLLEIALAEPASFAIVVSRSTARVRQLVGRSTILGQAKSLVSAARSGRDVTTEVKALSATLLSDMRELPSHRRVVISAEGSLQQVPFELLELPSPNGRRLLDTHVVSYTRLLEACEKYLEAKEATANTKRAVEFDRERLAVVKRLLGDIKLSAITREVLEGFQAKRRLEGASNRTVNMDIGAVRRVLKRFKQWRRLEDDVKMLTESGGAPIGRALTAEEQDRLLDVAQSNPEWQHVYCAAVLAANTSMRGVEIKHVRRKDVDLDAKALHIRKSKNEGSKRVLPLNDDALRVVKTMLERADQLGHEHPEHYLWCATQHHKLDPTKPASKWDTAWRALRDAAGLPKLRFHDLRHTVVTRLLEAGEPDHVVESITGHLSRRMLEHYSHIRLAAKRAALDRLERPRKALK